MILVNDLSVGLAIKLADYYDFIVEDGDCFATGKEIDDERKDLYTCTD